MTPNASPVVERTAPCVIAAATNSQHLSATGRRATTLRRRSPFCSSCLVRAKHFLLLLLFAPVWLSGRTIADGVGVFPVVVIVHDEANRPAVRATVRVEDGRPRNSRLELLDPVFNSKVQSIGKAVETDAHGAALLFCFGGWSSTDAKDNRTYNREVRGRIVVELPGFERAERLVSDVTQGRYTFLRSWAPVVEITLKRKRDAEIKVK